MSNKNEICTINEVIKHFSDKVYYNISIFRISFYTYNYEYVLLHRRKLAVNFIHC